MSSRRPSPIVPAKRSVAIKRVDGEPLSRTDIQYDVLYNIFHDTHPVFTDPYATEDKALAKVCFRDLYVKTILRSPKVTKAVKDKMTDSSAFAEDFGMLALLVNVGRINTTMSFFPEMKTAIRTYHPIPALQRTTGNLQDAPRIKHILKSAVLGNEGSNIPSTPADILARLREGQIPPTTVTNLIFILTNHSAPIGQQHFSGSLDFIDIFLRENVSSLSRARAFLWLCYHYLESPSSEEDYDGDKLGNPFADGRGSSPKFAILSDSGTSQENMDPEDEIALGKKLVAQRTAILKAQGTKESLKASGKPPVAGTSAADDVDDELMSAIDEAQPKGKRGAAKLKLSPASKEKKASTSAMRRQRLKEERKEEQEAHYQAAASESDVEDDHFHLPASNDRLVRNQYPQPRRLSVSPAPMSNRDYYSPYRRSSAAVVSHNTPKPRHRSHYPRRVSATPRSLLQQAWHVITTTDPLLDSDTELGDEQVRLDYVQRLQILTTVKGNELRPEDEKIANGR